MLFRFRRHLRRNDEGVASTVGTVMALLVALTFLALIVNQYVPVWQQEAEAAHMNAVLGDFGNLKSAIDSQVVQAQVNTLGGTPYIPIETYSLISLGIDGVPIFSSPTVGTLTGDGDAAPWTVQFTYAIDGTPYVVNQSAAGSVVLRVNSRYAVPFDLAYESGAVILSQTVGSAVRISPQFTALNGSNGVDVGFTLVQLIGSGNAAGYGTEGIRNKLLSLDMQDYDALQTSVWINHTTRYGRAWYTHFNTTLALAFGILPSDFAGPGYSYVEGPTGQTTTTRFYVLSRSEVNLTHTVSLEIVHDPVGGVPINGFTLNQAYVSMAVGRGGTTPEV
ncbi:MAG: hypothetical protein R3291_04000 [Thermoplasmata archaeon]|nr:hypothetical protein [Thermoplasmata archaeon]